MTSAAPDERSRLDASFVFIAACCGLFLLCVALRLNGSSSAFWANDLQSSEPTGLIAGTPRLTRSDEWMFWTPAALAQLHHMPPMPIKNPALGAGVAPLLMSVPVHHYSMFFRPQFWGFFVFDAERGFAWFWYAKLFGLLISFFLLFRMLLRERVVLAILGALAVAYSSMVQWFFSSPTMLPDMLGSWAVMLVAGRFVFHQSPVWKKAIAAILLAGSAVNFVLCCYPPFAIPLVYLGLTLFAAFLWERRGRAFHGGFLWLTGTALGAALALWPMFLECRPTLEIIAHTSYPGARRGSGGTMPIAHFFSGLLNFFDTNRPHPKLFPNASEASNFFPICIPVLGSLAWRWWKGRARGDSSPALVGRAPALCVALVLFILFFSFYALIGFPEWFCRITVLNFCTEKRVLLPIGVAGLILTFLSLREDGLALVAGRARFLLPVAVMLAALACFLWLRRQDSTYLTPGYCVLLVATTTLLCSLYFCSRALVFSTVLAGALLLNNFLVNPISEGLPILLESSAARRIAAIHQADPEAAWAAYERNTLAQFATASGARFLNGVKTVPDLDLLRRLDSSEASREIYNRYAFIALNLPPPGDMKAYFRSVADDSYQAFVSPFHPAMRAVGLRYVVFPRPLGDEERGTLRLIDALPANFIYIYKVDLLPSLAEATTLPVK